VRVHRFLLSARHSATGQKQMFSPARKVAGDQFFVLEAPVSFSNFLSTLSGAAGRTEQLCHFKSEGSF
jgi:hypothetical protein